MWNLKINEMYNIFVNGDFSVILYDEKICPFLLLGFLVIMYGIVYAIYMCVKIY